MDMKNRAQQFIKNPNTVKDPSKKILVKYPIVKNPK